MKTSSTKIAFNMAMLISLATASPTPMESPLPKGVLRACKKQGCDAGECPMDASVDAGYPQCLTYNSASKLGQGYAASDGHGYDVWWDSGAPNPTCKIVVRTPASTDLPHCGYFLSSWSTAGCYYTAIQDSFMLQFCCGSGDCNAASPSASLEEAQAQALLGNTTVVSIAIGDMTTEGEASGKRSIEGLGEMYWERSDKSSSSAPKAVQADALQDRGSCSFSPKGAMYTEGARQVKASATQVCNTPGGCSLTASVTVMEGESISPSLTGNFFMVISAAVGYTFTSSKSYTSTEMYTQTQGTTGYMSYIPTLNCWRGYFHDCYENEGGEIVQIDPNTLYTACTPAKRADGQLDGTFSFVYVH